MSVLQKRLQKMILQLKNYNIYAIQLSKIIQKPLKSSMKLFLLKRKELKNYDRI